MGHLKKKNPGADAMPVLVDWISSDCACHRDAQRDEFEQWDRNYTRGDSTMKRSGTRILTTHVGSLPRPKDLIELYEQDAPDGALQPRLKAAVADIVKQQVAAGVDVVNDGEFGKAMRRSVDYCAWWSYIYDRLTGYEVSQSQAVGGRRS
jgi:hypothetical protein